MQLCSPQPGLCLHPLQQSKVQEAFTLSAQPGSYCGQQPLGAAALTLDCRTDNAGTMADTGVPGNALYKPVSAATYSSHPLRGKGVASAAEQQHVLHQAEQQQIPFGSSMPVQSPWRPETLAASHRQPSKGTLPTPAVSGHVPHQPKQQPSLPECSLPGPAAGTGPQLAKPAAYQSGTRVMQHRQIRPASAQESLAAQRTQHQHISLKETYREPQHAASTYPVATGTGVSGEQQFPLYKAIFSSVKIF